MRSIPGATALLWTASILCCVGLAQNAFGALAVQYDPDDMSAPAAVGGIGPDTTGAGMAGAQIRATYNAGTPIAAETVSLSPTGTPGQGEAMGGLGYGGGGGPLWMLQITGDPETNDWQVMGLAGDPAQGAGSWGLDRLAIDLLPGGAVWDKTDPSPGTFDSGAGITFNFGNPTLPAGNSGAWDVTVAYSGPAVVGGGTPVGDVFRTLAIEFSSSFDVGDMLVFRADTDEAGTGRDLVPEPAALGLLGLGLLALRRRRT